MLNFAPSQGKTIMKQLTFILLFAAAVLSSCVSKQAARQVENQRDSLEMVVNEKDSLIQAVFADIYAISENLALIKSRENLIAVSGTPESGRRPVEEIHNDIAAIDRLLQENKAKIASLQQTSARLRKANLHIEELEKTIAQLNMQLTEKTAEIDRLRTELEKSGIEVALLTEQVEAGNARIEHLSGQKVLLENRLNTVYYIVGAEKELLGAQIIDKQGFFSRVLTVNKHANLDSFTQADSRLLTEIPVGQKRATLVTTHPDGSYQLITDADKRVTKLVIDDPVRFWENSKILVISYK